MKIRHFYGVVIGAVLSGALLIGCGGSHATLPPTGGGTSALARGALSNHGYHVLYRFKSISDGEYPGGLTNVNGVLFGVTDYGGSACAPNGCGTIFSITTSGKKQLLYSFKGGSDGAFPNELTDVDGTLYGTTGGGGDSGCYDYGCGTVFKVSSSGKEQILYRFKGATDGASPTGPLILLNGELYGETAVGGNTTCRNGCGTVFKVSTAGKEEVLYRFKGGTDGQVPLKGLTVLNDVLYGTTASGGLCEVSTGCGTIFKMSTAGRKTVLHLFKGAEFSDPSRDGGFPFAGLVAIKNTLYGTTQYGGRCCYDGGTMGTVYSVSASGKERVIYGFNGNGDGVTPASTLTVVNGVLYGTTIVGGSSKCSPIPCGTIFSVTRSGKEVVLYDFQGYQDNDGAQPQSTMLNLNGTLYGSTNIGGIISCGPSGVGCGTIFKISP